MSKLEIIKNNLVLDFSKKGANVAKLGLAYRDLIHMMHIELVFDNLEKALDNAKTGVLDTNVLDSESKVVVSNSNFINYQNYEKLYLTTVYTCFDSFDKNKYVGIEYFKELFSGNPELICELAKLIKETEKINSKRETKIVGNSNLVHVTEVLEFIIKGGN